MLLLFLLSCISIILVSNPLFNLLKAQFFEIMDGFSWFFKMGFSLFLDIESFLNVMKKTQNNEEQLVEKTEDDDDDDDINSLLDLHDLPLEYILEKLSPSGLCSMAGVCISLRKKCISDHFWRNHMKQKWGNLMSNAAYEQWQKHKDSRKRVVIVKQSEAQGQKGLFGHLFSLMFGDWNVITKKEENEKKSCFLPEESLMAWYLAIETGKFWFPAQILNRENGHVGFMMSCYDANVSYESKTDTFVARFEANGRRTIEDNIGWNRIRVAGINTPANVLYNSECLNELSPGDHIEIQWRRSKEFPYGWWYGVVGHLESCNGNESLCQCIKSDVVVIEFKQYEVRSRWRNILINRKEHGEEGNEGDGFYGGIRKLYNHLEISMWISLSPTTNL